MSVTAVEVFLNLWLRVRVEESAIPARRTSFLKALEQRRSLDWKLKNWPTEHLGARLDLESGPGQSFSEIKRQRNAIVHFTSSHETLEFGPYRIHGLADTTEYDRLGADDARCALDAAEGLVAEIFRLAGLAPQDIRHAMHAWTGKLTA